MTTISVTADDILHGERCQCTLCPVALATKRCTGAHLVSVAADQITLFFRDGSHMRFETPNSVKSFIRDFDDKRAVAPFEFEIPLEIEQSLNISVDSGSHL